MTYPNLGPMRPIVNIHWPGTYIAVLFDIHVEPVNQIPPRPDECETVNGSVGVHETYTWGWLEAVEYASLAMVDSVVMTKNKGETWFNIENAQVTPPATGAKVSIGGQWEYWNASQTVPHRFSAISGSEMFQIPVGVQPRPKFRSSTRLPMDVSCRRFTTPIICVQLTFDDEPYKGQVAKMDVEPQSDWIGVLSVETRSASVNFDGDQYKPTGIYAADGGDHKFWVLFSKSAPIAA